jgi:energy-coupling factor transporter ATP-binding protein EcfA2
MERKTTREKLLRIIKQKTIMLGEELEHPIPDSIEVTAESDDNFEKIDFHQWSIVGDGTFLPSPETTRTLVPGMYDPHYSNRAGEWGLRRQRVNTDELYELPTKEIQVILSDLKSFWKKKDIYKRFKLMHKRGILLYGDPGCGKSGILQLCMKHIIEDLSGLVINLKDDEAVRGYIDIIPKLRQIEPERPLVVIIEDIDAIAGDSSYITSQLLNLLDGVKQIENVVYIATTNYPEKLAERITNRPSRFDRRYLIDPPTKEVRLAYLKNKIGEDAKIDFETWVKDTEGMSMSHLKELFISVFLLDNDYDDAIANLRELKKSPRNKKQKTMGFSGVERE